LRSCFRNTLDGVGEIVSIPQVSAPCLEWNICDISAAKTLYQCNSFATTSDNKTLAGAKGRSLFFFDASTLEALGGPFEVSRDVIQRINCLEFSPDDKFVFFGRLDKWFSVGRGCVKDFPQFSKNPGLHDWGRFSSDGQHIVVKRNHFSDLPKTCQTKRCIEDLLSLWAVKEIDGGPDKEWTCSFRQLPDMVAGFSNMGIETSSLLRRLGINLMSCEVSAMQGSNYSSCYFCDQLKELKQLTDPSKESSLASVRQLVIKLYRWIFRYQVWNLETGRPLLQDVFNQCAQFNPFTYFCHVTSVFNKWGIEIGCAGVDQVMSVCNIAVVAAIDTFCRLRFDWSKRTYVRLSEREREWLRECVRKWMPEKRRSIRYFFLFPELGGIFKSLKRTLFREWIFKETHEETLKLAEREEEKKLTKMVERRLRQVLTFKEDLYGEEKKKFTEMVERRLMEAWKVEEDLHWEEWKLPAIIKWRLPMFWQRMKDLHGLEERELPEKVEILLAEFWDLMKFFRVGEEWYPEEIEDEMLIEECVSQILDGLRPGLWQLIWKWTLQLDLELFSDSFKRDVFLNFPKGFLDLVDNDISHGLSPRKMWMVNSREMGEVHLLRTGFQEQDSCDYSSEKQEYRITQAKYLTFTYDDLYVVFLSHENLLHALSLQTGTVFTSVSGRNCCYFTRERRVGYLFRSGTEEKAIFLTSLLNPCKFFAVLPGQDGEVGETTAAIFSSSDTVKSISSESLITSWRLVDHNRGFSVERISESSSGGYLSQVIKLQNCVFSTDGKLLAFQQHTQIKQCLVEEFEKSQCIVFEADSNFTDLCLAFSSDGVFLLFSILDNFSGHLFYVWDVQGEVLSKSFSSASLLSIDSFCLSSDNRNLVLCGGEYEIEIWEFRSYPRHLFMRICVERPLNPVKFSHCGVSQDTELLVCCLANTIFLHILKDADIRSTKRVLRGHLGKIEFCKFLKSNRYLISYAVDGMVFLWDISESKAIGFARIAKGREKILCMAVSPDEDRAVCFISSSRVCVLNFCNLKCALPAGFFTAPRKGRISTAETSLLPVGKIPSTSNVPASRFEDDQHGSLDLEEQFLLTPEDLLDSDESDDCVDYDDSD